MTAPAIYLLPLNIRTIPVIHNGRPTVFDSAPLDGRDCLSCANNGACVRSTTRDNMGVSLCDPCWRQIALESA